MSPRVLTEEEKLQVVSMLAHARNFTQVSRKLGIPELLVMEVGKAYGWPHLGKLEESVHALQKGLPDIPEDRPAVAAPVSPQPSARTTAPPAKSVSQIATQPAAVLLDLRKRAQPWGYLVRRVDSATTLLERLQADIVEAERKAAAKRAEAARAAEIKAAATAEKDRLRGEIKAAEAKLARMRAQLRSVPSNGQGHPKTATAENAAIRAWAAENGIECAPRGYIAKHVREAWEKAQA